MLAITLFPVLRALAQACDELIELIKEHGRWVEPPKEEVEESAKELVSA